MDFKNVTVAGSGVLGSQIAFQTAFKGFDVTIWLRSEGSIERAKPKLERLKGIYLQTMEAWKTNPQAYCRGFADSPDLSADEIDALKEKVVEAFDAFPNVPAVPAVWLHPLKAEFEAGVAEILILCPQRYVLPAPDTLDIYVVFLLIVSA